MYIAYDYETKRIMEKSNNKGELSRKYLPFYATVGITDEYNVNIEKRAFEELEFEYII